MSLVSFYWKVKEYLQSQKKGISYIASSDGSLYHVRESRMGRLVAKASNIPELDSVTEGFRFDLPKIPEELFQLVYSFFKAFCKKADVEVMLQIFYDTEKEEYFLECPFQEVSKVRVNAELSERYIGRNSLRYIQVAQIHSHNSMSAYFSAIDDEDEKSYLIYGVFGRLDSEQPQCLFRVKSNDSYVLIPAQQIFEGTNLKEVEFPREWEAKVIM